MKKKKLVIFLVVLLVGSGTTLYAQDYKFGLGIRLSNAAPTLSNSITAKYFMNGQDALEAMVSFGTRFGVGVLYEKHRPLGEDGFQWFYGAGGYIGFQVETFTWGRQVLSALIISFRPFPSIFLLTGSLSWI